MNRLDIIRMAHEAGFMAAGHPMNPWSAHTDQIEVFAALVAAHEREECAKWADLVAREIDNTNNTATYIASGIRARGEK
jgi:hypothetical protein